MNNHDDWEHVGRIEISNNMWAWSKIISSDNMAKSDYTAVKALAVDPSGLNVAAVTMTL